MNYFMQLEYVLNIWYNFNQMIFKSKNLRVSEFDKHMRKYEISRRYINDKYLLWSTFWIYSMKMLLKYFCPQVHTIDESSSSWVQSVWWLSESILFYDRYYFFLLKHTNIPSQPNNSGKNNTGMWEWERRCNLMKLGNLFSQVNKKGRELSKRTFHSYLSTFL